MPRILYLFLLVSCLALASCGGGSDEPPAPPPTPTIRYEGTYENNTLALAPLAGTSSIGSRPIAKVELRVDHGAPQVLTATNATNAAGQAIYLFPVTTTGEPAYRCGVPVSFEIIVTDVDGFAFTKYVATCHRHIFGAFSDWGPGRVDISATGTLPMRTTFSRSGPGGYSDEGNSLAGVLSASWSLNAREGDQTQAFTAWNAGASGATSLVVQSPNGNSAVSHGTATESMNAIASEVVCCTGTPVTAGTTRASRTVSLVVAPGFTRPFFTTEPPPQFDVRYRIVDPVTQAVITEFSGTGADYTSYTFDIKDGYLMTLQASPRTADAQATLYISYGTGRDLDSPSSSNSLGSAQSNRVGVPAALNIICCSLAR